MECCFSIEILSDNAREDAADLFEFPRLLNAPAQKPLMPLNALPHSQIVESIQEPN